jgi:hypothetical protein
MMSRDPFGIRIPRLPDLKPEAAREATPPVGELNERVKLSAETLLKCAEPERVMAEAWQGVIRGLLAELSAAPAPAPPAGETARERIAEHQHRFQDYSVCTECGQTEAAIAGCHHCDEVTPGKRCWWCLRLRGAGGTHE